MLIPMLHNHGREDHGRILSTLANIVNEGALKVIVDEPSFGLEDVGKAHDRLSGGQAMGKIVVTVE